MYTKNLYYVYLTTNAKKTVLYTGMTNNHESAPYIQNIIAREKEIKGWPREKKAALIHGFNPQWKFLNEELFGKWPPEELIAHRGS